MVSMWWDIFLFYSSNNITERQVLQIGFKVFSESVEGLNIRPLFQITRTFILATCEIKPVIYSCFMTFSLLLGKMFRSFTILYFLLEGDLEVFVKV